MSYYDPTNPKPTFRPRTPTLKRILPCDEMNKLRHSATAALSEREDVIIVASVSCIYGLGSLLIIRGDGHFTETRYD